MARGVALDRVLWCNCWAAIVEAFYPGELGGTAIMDVLRGVVNPSGTLPITVYVVGAVQVGKEPPKIRRRF